MLDFIPFIPSGTEGIPDTLWNTALHSWMSNLSQLLSLSDTDFLDETSSNTSLSAFIDQVLDAQLDSTTNDTLLKYIFLVYHRLSLLEPSSTHHVLLSIQKLCSFAIVYNASNTAQLRAMMKAFVHHYTEVEKQLIATLDMLLENIQAIPKAMNENAYVLLRLLEALLSATLDAVPFPSHELDQTVIACYKALPVTMEGDDDENFTAYLIKRLLVSIFNLHIDVHFFRPLGFVSSFNDLGKLIPTEELRNEGEDTILEQLSETILKYIEEGGLDTPRSAFEDAPLVMDWEIEYHISEKLTFINQTKFAGEEVRLEFLSLSMEQVRDTNTGGRTLWITKSPPQQQLFEKTEQDPEIELTSKISQVLDLMPDLGEGFIEACLNANDGDVEQVIMQLLDDSLPSTVSGLDRSMARNNNKAAIAVTTNADEGESILKSRHNIYDNDEFDIFAHRTVDASKVYTGKKDKGDADTLLDDKSFIQTEKKNVLQRVVDMYDDDYDDTYDDINDAGVPSTIENGDGDSALDIVRNKTTMDPGVQNESILVHTFMENPELFGRNGTARKSTQRAALRKKTAMTDEQLEGWAIMFNRNVSLFVLRRNSVFIMIYVAS
jgi:hypothetical protein